MGHHIPKTKETITEGQCCEEISVHVHGLSIVRDLSRIIGFVAFSVDEEPPSEFGLWDTIPGSTKVKDLNLSQQGLYKSFVHVYLPRCK